MSTKRWRKQQTTEAAQIAAEHLLPLDVHMLLALLHHHAGRHGIEQQERIANVIARVKREAPILFDAAERVRGEDLDRRHGRKR